MNGYDYPAFDEDQLMNNEFIGTTGTYYSGSFSKCVEYRHKNFLIYNGQNQNGSFQVQGDRGTGFADPFPVGAEMAIDKADKDSAISTEYWPYMRVKAVFPVAATTGSLNIYVEKMGN